LMTALLLSGSWRHRTRSCRAYAMLGGRGRRMRVGAERLGHRTGQYWLVARPGVPPWAGAGHGCATCRRSARERRSILAADAAGGARRRRCRWLGGAPGDGQPAVDVGDLRLFVVLAEELQFSRAVARLHLSQPRPSIWSLPEADSAALVATASADVGNLRF
jgi:hypothetical protein